jgi:hypothetical protein
LTDSDRRLLPRKIASQRIQVRDINTDRHLGEVVNLTSEGLMIISVEPVENNLVFQLDLELRTPYRGYSCLRLGVESLWCSVANEAQRFWTGFRIIDVSLDTIEIIESLIDSWDLDETLH